MGENSKLTDREKSLLDDNLNLKAQLKELEATFNKMQADFTRSIKMREKLDSLCKVLQKQTQDIKDESATEIGKAEGHGTKLAREVADNMEMMQSVNKQLSDIMTSSLKAKQENTDLTGEVGGLKTKYDDKHELMTDDLKKANDELIKTKTEVAQLRLKSAQEREQVYGEMQKLANTLVENRQQMKNAKDLEIELRERLKSYDEKFTSLQSSLRETNTGYTSFTAEMEKVTQVAKSLDTETQDWQKKWEVNNGELLQISHEHEHIQGEVARVHENLIKMTQLYQQLERQRSDLLKKLGREPPAPNKDPSEPAGAQSNNK